VAQLPSWLTDGTFSCSAHNKALGRLSTDC
jgi:hypothetical protein